MNAASNKYVAVIALFLSSTGWGLTWLPAKALAAMGLGSQHFILIAFGAGAVALLPFLWRQYKQWLPQTGRLLAIAAVGGFAYASFQTAIARGDTVRVMILFYLLPIWSALGGRIFLRERIDARRIAAVLICIVGAALTLDLQPVDLLPRNLSTQYSLAGGKSLELDWIDLLAALSGLAFVGNNLLFRADAMGSIDRQPIPLGSKVAAMYCGCAAQIALSLWLFPTDELLPRNAALPLAMLYGALWITLLTFATQWAVTQMEVSRSAIIIVMELVAAVISTALLTAHDLSVREGIGATLVLVAAVLEGMCGDGTEEVAAV